MKIVINISEEQYEIIKELVKNQNRVCPEADSAEKIILNGAPLPKKHGRLIDADELKSRMKIGYRIVDEVPTIIESESWENS